MAVGERESEGQDCDTHTSHNDKPLLTTSYYPDNIFLAHLPSPVSDIRSGASPVSWWKNATLPNHSPPPVNGAVEHQESLLFHHPLLLLSQPPRPPQFWFQSGGGEGRDFSYIYSYLAFMVTFSFSVIVRWGVGLERKFVM